MGVLGHLFYPWGLILQGVALWHFVKRRPDGFWLWIIIFGGPLGAGVYVFAEMIPDLGLLRGTFQGLGRKSRIQTLEAQILDNPSAGNLEELAELYFDNKDYAKAREALDRAVAARSDSPHAFYLRAKATLAMADYAAAIPDLEHVVAKDSKFDYYRATGLLGDAYARTGHLDRAAYYFAPAVQYSTTPETLFNYANYLKTAGQKSEAEEWVKKLAAKKRTLPRYMQRVERPWFRKGKALEKELQVAK
ncbi:MAG TPA: tetratricopeptide repeat protein [Dongiaceae bacterium]|nr:tetratricopeptide repeat protein [Dongiaceae bacterium]